MLLAISISINIILCIIIIFSRIITIEDERGNNQSVDYWKNCSSRKSSEINELKKQLCETNDRLTEIGSLADDMHKSILSYRDKIWKEISSRYNNK